MNSLSSHILPSSTQTPPSPPAYAEVVFNLPIREAFTYEIPPHFLGQVQRGMRVLVPFGPRRVTGYVVSLSHQFEKEFSLKPIEDLLDTEPVLSGPLLDLTRWIAEYYQSSWGEAIKAALPAGLDEESRDHLVLTGPGLEALESGSLGESGFLLLETLRLQKGMTQAQLQKRMKRNFSAHLLARFKKEGWVTVDTRLNRTTSGYKMERRARLTRHGLTADEVASRLRRSPRQKALYQLLTEGEQPCHHLAQLVPDYSEPLRKLKEKGLAESIEVKAERQNALETSDPAGQGESPLTLTPEQGNVFAVLNESIEKGEFQTFLLHGITGSGKTEIYLRCIQAALEAGKTAIMGVPEISLTPQTVDRFRRRFGDRVAILHSALTPIERYGEWKKIRDGRVSIAVGARSAIFAPFDRIGVIVIDEEHDPSYKQDSTPRYHARDAAIVRARASGAVVLLGSATPSMESFFNAQSGKYRYLALERRINEGLLPVVRMVDMRKEREERKNFSFFSHDLTAAIRDRLDRSEQVFLFLNRRGTANYVFCRDCGFVFECRRCSVALTFHGSDRNMRCHYCNSSSGVPRACPDCGGEVLRFTGFGTQKMEEEIRRLFPEARVMRLDRDTTRDRSSFDTMHQKMRSREIDILIGTQMITKGHDFPNVTLVGVVHADLSLHIPDFRSSERTFQLLTQVAGRAGRGKVPGRVIVQSHNPDHYVYDYVREHDYLEFVKRELEYREKLSYPPITRLVALGIECETERGGEEFCRKLKEIFTSVL
ncbi:MAG: primosomal protein N', partial [Nitrospinae bacterium CG11_big_fil_rev_8_21_14_0_20_56_8]